MASNGGPCVERAEDVVEEDRQVLSFACPVRPEASMDALIPDASLRCPRQKWESHQSWHTFLGAGGFNGCEPTRTSVGAWDITYGSILTDCL
jgi:hypothetical protein